jgi:hypothetical protein
MIDQNFKSLGFKDMHPMQVNALLELVGITMNLASMAEDNDIAEDVTAYCDEVIKLFGGNGVRMIVEVDV